MPTHTVRPAETGLTFRCDSLSAGEENTEQPLFAVEQDQASYVSPLMFCIHLGDGDEGETVGGWKENSFAHTFSHSVWIPGALVQMRLKC